VGLKFLRLKFNLIGMVIYSSPYKQIVAMLLNSCLNISCGSNVK